jgi:GNAT superfamily N-acetyltransferase
MILRPLQPGEAETLAAACVTIDPYRRLGYGTASLSAYLRRTDTALTIEAIEHQGRLAGVLCRRRPWLRGPLIEMLTLLPWAQGQGLGGALIARCQAEAGANLWATVSAFHAPARRFYARHGFAELCQLPGLVQEDESEILLRWQRRQTMPSSPGM